MTELLFFYSNASNVRCVKWHAEKKQAEKAEKYMGIWILYKIHLKGIVHPELKFSLFAYPHVIPPLIFEIQIKVVFNEIWEISVLQWKSMQPNFDDSKVHKDIGKK